jgi:hypothetical protein
MHDEFNTINTATTNVANNFVNQWVFCTIKEIIKKTMQSIHNILMFSKFGSFCKIAFTAAVLFNI